MAGEDEVDSSPTALQVPGLLPGAGQTAKRGEELLARKQQNSSHRTSSDPAAAELKCDRCENKAASVKGLKQHIRRSAHKDTESPPPHQGAEQGGILPQL